MVTIARDVRAKFGAARDQGSRPTCLAFATSDVHAAARASSFIPLSAEFLYFHAVKHSVPPQADRGVTLTAVESALSTDGQPLETGWPYLSSLPHPISKWVPPNGLTVFRQMLSRRSRSVEAVITALDADRPVLLVLKISEAFYTPAPDGQVSTLNTDADVGYHAVVAVAHGLSGTDPVILVRNSWGQDWGLSGHAWLDSEYVSDRLNSASIIA